MVKSLFLTLLIISASLSVAEENELILWSGGISFDERSEAPAAGTKLVFFVESGSFLASMKVSVKDESGEELVNFSDTGPWLILDLPEGKYSVIAERSNGDTQSAVITVDAGITQEFSFRFPET